MKKNIKIHKTFFLILSVFLLYPVYVYADDVVRERVYLQTDKQTYLSGELLWMKFYLTDEYGKPSSISKIGYVELVDESTAQVQEKLEIKDGLAEGWMELPITLPTGNYRLVAYTQNMRNEGETVYFNKIIGIINTFKTDALTIADTVVYENNMPSLSDGNINVTTRNQSYSTRTSSEIQITGLPENIHSLSVSVAGADLVNHNEDIQIWSNNLKEYTSIPVKADFLSEYEGHIINGKITDMTTNQAPSEENVFSLLGFVGDQVRLFGANSDNNGDVRFFTKRITGSRELAVSTISSSENNYRISIESPFVAHQEKTMPELLLNPQWKEQLLQRSVGMQVQYAYSADSMSRVDTTYSYFRHKPDRSYILDEYTRFTTMEEVVIEFVSSLRFRQYSGKKFLSVVMNDVNFFSLNMLVLLDGIPILDHDIIFNYNPLLVYKIDVYKDMFIFGSKYFEGMIFLTTYNRDYPGLVVDETTHLIDYEGTQLHRYFYTPTYSDNESVDSKMPDLRHTLLWDPEVKTNGQTALSIPFCTSDLTGDFQVTVEGISKDGKVIRGVSFFSVEN